MSTLKPISIGYENFKELLDKGCYYVDKTLMIQEIIDKRSKVNLYTRPRRFGKTLNLSMIRYFFEKNDTDNAYLFENLNIGKAGEKYTAYQGQFFVISLSLKSMKQPNFKYSFIQFKELVIREIERHSYVLQSENLSPKIKERFESFYYGKAVDSDYITVIKLLSDCLYAVHQKNVIILIDEYDVLLKNSHFMVFMMKKILPIGISM